MKIVKIGAMWCPGCLVIHKDFNRIKDEYPSISYTELDMDFDEEEVEKYNVGNVLPVIIFFDGEKEITRLVGEKKYNDIKEVIDSYEK